MWSSESKDRIRTRILSPRSNRRPMPGVASSRRAAGRLDARPPCRVPFAVAFAPRVALPATPSIMQILFADYDFPDIDLEREIFASAGLDLKLAQCTDGSAGDRRCARLPPAILLQYAPITARVVAALPGARHRQPDRRGLRHGRHRRPAGRTACGSPIRPTTAWARSPRMRWRWRSRSCATSFATIATSAPARWHYLSSGNAAPAGRADARHRRASGASASGWRTCRATSSSASSRATRYLIDGDFPGLRRARAPTRGAGGARRTSCRCTRRSTRRRAAWSAPTASRRRSAGHDARQHVARRGRRHRAICSRRSMLEYCGAPRWTCCPRSRCRADRSCSATRVSS